MKDLASSPLGINSTLTPEDYASANLSISDRRFVYSTLEQSLIFALIYLGTTMFFVPTVYCNQRLGIHRTHAITSAVMILATAMTPFATVYGVKTLLVARFLAGIAFTNLFAVAGDVVARWAPAKERGLFVGIATSYIQLSCVVSMPLSGFLAER
ncbi:Protein Y51B9A.6 b, partial [Aphelenchoides avenae]